MTCRTWSFALAHAFLSTITLEHSGLVSNKFTGICGTEWQKEKKLFIREKQRDVPACCRLHATWWGWGVGNPDPQKKQGGRGKKKKGVGYFYVSRMKIPVDLIAG